MGDHLAIPGGLLQAPWTLSKQMFRGGRQVFQVGQAPSGPTVIRPLVLGTSYTLENFGNFESRFLDFTKMGLSCFFR